MKLRCEKDCEKVILLGCKIHTFSQCHDKKMEEAAPIEE